MVVTIAVLFALALLPGCSALNRVAVTRNADGRPEALNCNAWIQGVEVQDASGMTVWKSERPVSGGRADNYDEDQVVVGVTPDGWQSTGDPPVDSAAGVLIVATSGTYPPTKTAYALASLEPGQFVVQGQSLSATAWRNACNDLFWGTPGWILVAGSAIALAGTLLFGTFLVRYARRPLRPPPPRAPTAP